MGRPYKRYTRQFKEEAMDLVRVRGYGVAHAARDLGVPTTTLNMWLEKAGWVRPAEGAVDPDADGLTPPSQDPARLRARVSELERQVAAGDEKEILKKATALREPESVRFGWMGSTPPLPAVAMCAAWAPPARAIRRGEAAPAPPGTREFEGERRAGTGA